MYYLFNHQLLMKSCKTELKITFHSPGGGVILEAIHSSILLALVSWPHADIQHCMYLLCHNQMSLSCLIITESINSWWCLI